MDRKIRIGAVSYLNTKPLIYGFEKGLMKEEIDLLIDYPARMASMLLKNEIDIGLVPVAIIPSLKEHHIISDYCIGCDGEVASVCLFSDVPLTEIKSIFLDYQSKTSVALLKFLVREYWKISPELIDGEKGYEEMINGNIAGLVIGDRALEKKSTYKYDLGLAWKEMTGLPFVFACWISNKKPQEDFIERFNSANKTGIDNLEKVVASNSYNKFDLMRYYTECISYKLDIRKRAGLNLFLSKIS